MLAGRYEAACPALAESYRLDPLPGALFTLAECDARAGKLASAVERYDEYLALYSRMSRKEQAGQRGRDKAAASAKAKLMPRVPMIALRLPPDAPSDTLVWRDEVRLNAPALGVPLPVDPGEHVIATQVPGGPKHEQRVTVAAGDNVDLKLEIERAPATTSLAPAAPPAAPDADQSTSSPISWPTYVSFGIGGLGILAGTVTGAMSLSKTSTIKDSCDGNVCPPSVTGDRDSAQTLATISNVSFAVGVAGVGVGIATLLWSPKTEERTDASGAISLQPVLGPGMAGLQGRF